MIHMTILAPITVGKSGRLCYWCAEDINPSRRADARYCSDKCSQAKYHNAQPRRGPVYGRTCVWCAGEIDPSKRITAKYCSRKCQTAKDNDARRVPCQGGCGSLLTPHGSTPGPICLTCRARARGCLTPEVRAGGYAKCRCEGCVQAARDAVRASNLEYLELHGESRLTTWWRTNAPDHFRLSRDHRLSLYERDNWMCGICHEPTSRTWTAMDPLSPTLDHIEPKSRVLIPDHGDANLRTAHAICNKMRGNRMEPDDVIAAKVKKQRQTNTRSPLTLIGK